jgi:heme/copper-type cytochrome/quinol oxidase subunit 4
VTDHFLLLALFAFFVSLIFAVLLRDDPRGQLRLGSRMFGAFLAAAFILGWLMYPLPI